MRAAAGRGCEAPPIIAQVSWRGDMPKTLVIGPWTLAESG